MAPRKSHPKGIDPANPQKNFVKASYENKNDMDGWYEYMYGGSSLCGDNNTPPRRTHNVHGHAIGQRAGKLRYSGNPKAHRIGKR